ncbi:hypothetical protein CBR_g50881 [Chara braunii]|uniref:Uncharacterized protein n=1 Tax=Chara braunii TaxID=69332 RepID=A0A388M7G7_CHABU|nr:hypothetical protein CBR_g50881 [Chara braunii]|eukprot:GBG90537.1 hypothetical protein CBR_g50881 [Chara braunii]
MKSTSGIAPGQSRWLHPATGFVVLLFLLAAVQTSIAIPANRTQRDRLSKEFKVKLNKAARLLAEIGHEDKHGNKGDYSKEDEEYREKAEYMKESPNGYKGERKDDGKDEGKGYDKEEDKGGNVKEGGKQSKDGEYKNKYEKDKYDKRADKKGEYKDE